jgi:eukaryotic translation initiation factor 2C
MLEFQNASFSARMDAFVRNIRIKTTHLGYKKTAKKLGKKNANQHKFNCAELGNREVTVAEYFKASKSFLSSDHADHVSSVAFFVLR